MYAHTHTHTLILDLKVNRCCQSMRIKSYIFDKEAFYKLHTGCHTLHKVHCLLHIRAYSYSDTINFSAPAKQCVLIFVLIQTHIVPFPLLRLYMVS